MDLINQNQIFGAVLFFAGVILLTFCNKYERHMDEKLRDPKLRWSVIDGNKNILLKQKSFRGALMTVIGFGSAASGFILFMMNFN